jgi:transcriptional regulator with GAF, ATPase, and Fis domain
MPELGQTQVATMIQTLARACWGDASPWLLVGRHPSFTAVLERLARLAGSEAAVLINGETGTGKELFARALYLLSRRRGRPFLRVNCAQYQDGHLMASELFGYKKGSFTGAVGDHVGVFESADGGVVFLDEIAELTAPAQAMLLRVLGEGEIVPVGETSPRRVDVRVVAATGADLTSRVESGRFRLDLYYRLRSLHLQIPPVRERGRDWELIGAYYLHQLATSPEKRKRFSPEAIDVLSRYDWPGNVRELKGLVDAGFHLSESEWIEPRHFLESLEQAARVSQFERMPLLDVESELYDRMASGEASFWQLVHRPYLERELSRGQVRSLIARGLDAARGSYKRLLPLFGLREADYARFMDFLRHHDLKPPRH